MKGRLPGLFLLVNLDEVSQGVGVVGLDGDDFVEGIHRPIAEAGPFEVHSET